MKTLINFKTVVENGKATITADISEHIFEQPVQRVTVNHHVPENMAWPRHCQISHEAYFVKAFGNGIGIMHDELVSIAVAIEPKISHPPLFRNRITSALSLNVVSELPVTLEWQSSPDGKTWAAIAGETLPSLDASTIKKRDFVRCVATNAAGVTATDAIMIE